MKKILLSVAIVAACIGSAFAADLPSKKAAPVFVPPPPPLWTGFYVGLNAGGTFAGSNSVSTIGGPFFAAPTFANESAVASLLATSNTSINNGGFIGGGQVGYNYQFNNSFVVGVEADIQGVAGTSSSGSAFSASGVPAFPLETMIGGINVSKSLDYLGTVRGRVGYLVTPTLLIYGTGGLAYGGANLNASFIQADTLSIAGCGFCMPYGGSGAFSDTLLGWTAGGGLEWLFMPNWSAKIEYLYYDLGTATTNSVSLVSLFTGGGVAWAAAAQASARFNGNIVRAGVNYHFNWAAPAPVVAKY